MVPMKATLLFVLLCLRWSLVEVQSQTEYPYIFFRRTILPNHSYVNISRVRENRNWNTLQCHTDLSTCCHSQNGIPARGDWFAPGSDTRLPFGNEEWPHGIYQDRQSQIVHLRRNNSAANEPSGIYHCVIPTNAVHDDSDPSVGETVCVGLYTGEGGTCAYLNNTLVYTTLCPMKILFVKFILGVITIPGGILFTVDSDLNGVSLQFTLTCISTGGPATIVTWTRNSVTVTEGNKTVLDNHVTSQYTHTLTVTGRLGGLYTCTVANNRPSGASALLTVQGIHILYLVLVLVG